MSAVTTTTRGTRKLSTPSSTIARWGVAALAATFLTILTACSGKSDAGPLFVGEDLGRTESGGAWDTGTTISFGAPKIRNPTDNPILVKDITLRPVEKNPGVSVTAVYVINLTGISETSGLAVGFPPANQANHVFVPAAGATLQPNTWYQVLFVVRIDKDGEWVFPSFDISYEANRRGYKANAPDGLRLCAPKGSPCGKAP